MCWAPAATAGTSRGLPLLQSFVLKKQIDVAAPGRVDTGVGNPHVADIQIHAAVLDAFLAVARHLYEVGHAASSRASVIGENLRTQFGCSSSAGASANGNVRPFTAAQPLS